MTNAAIPMTPAVHRRRLDPRTQSLANLSTCLPVLCRIPVWEPYQLATVGGARPGGCFGLNTPTVAPFCPVGCIVRHNHAGCDQRGCVHVAVTGSSHRDL